LGVCGAKTRTDEVEYGLQPSLSVPPPPTLSEGRYIINCLIKKCLYAGAGAEVAASARENKPTTLCHAVLLGAGSQARCPLVNIDLQTGGGFGGVFRDRSSC